MKKLFLLVLIIISSVSLNSCFMIRQFTGSNINQEQFDKAREAKMLQVKAKAMERMSKSIDSKVFENSDMIISLSKDFVAKFVKQYEGISGWLDAETQFTVTKIDIKLENAVAFATLDLLAKNKGWGVDVVLKTDCLLEFEIKDNELYVGIEPFNISPVVSSGWALSTFDEVIADIIKVNLGSLRDKFPPIKMPVDFNNSMKLAGVNINIKDKVNLLIQSPDKNIDYTLKLKDIMISSSGVIVPFNIEKINIK